MSDVLSACLSRDITYNVPKPDDDLKPIAASEAWALTADALTAYMPELAEQVLQVRDFCEVNFEAAAEKPYTLDRGAGEMPFVSLYYRNTPADVLCIAHEFGHALQYYLAQGRFIPPIVREIAAFTAERMLLEHVSHARRVALTALEGAWEQDNRGYIGEDLEGLIEALKEPNTAPYLYCQNYPLARLYVEATPVVSKSANWGGVFAGDIDWAGCLPRLMEFVTSLPKINYLPEMPQANPDKPALGAYAALGAMALLDMAQPESDASKSIEDYYEKRLKHLRESTSFMGLGIDRKPSGYALWQARHDDEQSLDIIYCVAPFGEKDDLRQALRSRHSNEVIS